MEQKDLYELRLKIMNSAIAILTRQCELEMEQFSRFNHDHNHDHDHSENNQHPDLSKFNCEMIEEICKKLEKYITS